MGSSRYGYSPALIAMVILFCSPAQAQLGIPTVEIATNPQECQWMAGKLGSSDVRKAYRAAKRAHIDKDEYEAEDSYLTRVQSALPHIVGTSGYLWASSPIFSGLGKYDADAQTLTYKDFELSEPLDMSLVYKGGAQIAYYGADQSHTQKDFGSYVGQNAFGATALVSVSETDKYEVGYRPADTDYRSDLVNKVLRIQVSPDKAKAIREHLVLTIGGPLSAPYVVDNDSGFTPTLDTPVSSLTHKHILVVSPACGSISDPKTGEVLATFLMPPL